MIARRLQRRNRMFRVTARPLHGTLVAKSLQIDNEILISGFVFWVSTSRERLFKLAV